MGRAPNRRDLGPAPGPEPNVGGAGKIQSRKPPAPPHGKKPLMEPIQAIADKVTGIAPSTPDKPTVAPKRKQIAGKQTPDISEEVATGTAFLPGKRQVDMTHAQTEGLVENGDPGMPAEVPVPYDVAGKGSVKLAAHVGVPLAQIADTSNARKKNVFNGNHSTVDSVVFGLDADDSKHADKRDFTGAAGNLSETAAMSGLFSEKVDKVSFEDIPHAKFAPPGLRKVDSMGSRAEEII